MTNNRWTLKEFNEHHYQVILNNQHKGLLAKRLYNKIRLDAQKELIKEIEKHHNYLINPVLEDAWILFKKQKGLEYYE